MSKRFFSLLLVLALAFSFAAPAFAVSDEPATIASGAFDTKFDNGGNGSFHDALAAAEAHLNNAKVDEGKYDPEAWKAMKAAYDAAVELRDNYDAGLSNDLTAQKVASVRAELEAAVAALAKSDGATPANVADLKAAIASAKALADGGTLMSTAKTAIEKAYKYAQGFVDSYENGDETPKNTAEQPTGFTNTTAVAKFSREAFMVLTDYVKKVVADNEDTVNTVSVSIKEGELNKTGGTHIATTAEGVLMQPAQQKVEIVFDVDEEIENDEFTYAASAKLNSYDEVFFFGKHPSDSQAKGRDALKPGTLVANNELTLTDLAVTSGNVDSTKTVKGFEEGDKLTITLYTAVQAYDRYGVNNAKYDRTQVDQYVITYSTIPATPAPLDVKTASYTGYVADQKDPNAKNAGKFIFELNGEIKVEGVGLTAKFTDSKLADYTSLNWYIKAPNGVELIGDAIEPKNGANNGKITWEVGTGDSDSKLLDKLNDKDTTLKDLPVGKYTLALVGQKDSTVGYTAIFSKEVEVKALDKTPLADYLKELGLDQATLEKDFGPYNSVTSLVVAVKAANDYLAKTEPDTPANGNLLGRAKDEAKDETEGTGEFGKIDRAYNAVYSVVALRDLVAKAEALDPDDYNNWYTGLLMGGAGQSLSTNKAALIKAKIVLNAATMSDTDIEANKADFKMVIAAGGNEVNIDVAGADDDAYNTQEKIDALVAELQKAIDLLDSKFANLDALQALIDAAPTDGTKYTATSWKALQDAITAAKAVIDSKPNAADQSKVDDAIAALQAALKGLVPVTGEIEKVTEDGKDYIVEDGEKLSGVQEVDGKLYYASVKDQHILKGGLVTGEGGKKYLAGDDGVLKLGYQKVGDKAYYFAKDGHMLRNGIVTGTGKQYVAAKDGVLGTGLVTAPNGNKYYCSVKDNHIMKAPKGKGTAPVIGPNNTKYTVNEKGVVVG